MPDAASVFLIYEDEETYSVWTTEEAALARASESGGRMLVTESPADPPVWSDWGEVDPDVYGKEPAA